MCTRARTRIHTHSHTHTHTHMHTHVHAHTLAHAHTCTHAQSQKLSQWLDNANSAANQRQGEEEEAAQILATTVQPSGVRESVEKELIRERGM